MKASQRGGGEGSSKFGLLIAMGVLLPQQHHGDAGTLELLADVREGANEWLERGRAGWYSRASSISPMSVWATAQSSPATRTNDAYLPKALVEILSARPTSVKLRSACRCIRTEKRLLFSKLCFNSLHPHPSEGVPLLELPLKIPRCSSIK
jgi:hypothetical protein